ncbi:TPA: phage tail protein [Proteus mirabilis]|uniref:phage tail-collar fiber domain-containing protein n=1 Tax=Proteus TaxID=583 RepID=UPI0013766502|nr:MULTISPECIES: phage tail protein [Proteus]ELA7632621.1 phage tail protein [Proteus mirabilis]MBG2793827.1 phage tail protein [Proteus mirabilis]MBG2978392.1 phage tail protein [Proteus mirabilis]MBG3072822.1 phage tail protein [Proteus mirabilis]MBG3094950.1 phage tail protein [Proteus mirabilis]
MSAKFFALLTVIGANKLAKATALGTTLKITQMAVGDGGGTLPMPSAEQTKLVNEKRRAGINTLFIDSKNANQIVAEQVIPENEGGYWIREIGLFDDEGSLIAVGNCPETYKPQLQEGSGRTQTIRMILTVSHTESVELKVDPSVILATRESVDNAIEIASKSILDTVEKEYATKDEVKKKFDNRNIVHEKGASKEKVISQKGVTELFQPKGNYQPAGNYVTTATFNLEINKKIDKASLSQQLGNDVNKVPSLDLVTKELGNKQPKGDYALKTWVDNIYYKRDDSPSFNEISATAIRVNSVNVALKGDCYTKSESDNKYSPKLPFVYSSGEESKIISPNNKILIFVNDNGTTGGYDRDTQATVWGFDKRGFMTRGTVHFDRMSGVYSQSQVDAKLKECLNLKTSSKQFIASDIYAPTFITGSQYGERSYLEHKSDELTITHISPKSGATNITCRNKSGTLALLGDLEDVNNIPVGSPIPWSLATAPSGYLICNGQTFNKSTYPKLAVAYPSGKLPDLRGEFIRGLDSGRGIDAGRSVLSVQKGNSLLSSNIFGGLSSSESNKWHKAINYIGITGTDNDGGYGVHQQIEGANGNETRPRNIAFLYIVRAA